MVEATFAGADNSADVVLAKTASVAAVVVAAFDG